MRTGGERRMTSLNGAEVSAAWSPDGRTIAFQNENFETLDRRRQHAARCAK